MENSFKSLMIVAALSIPLAAYAADQNPAADQQGGMMQGNMMKNCQSYIKDGKMMDTMPKDMMDQCQQMMKNDGMMNGKMMQQGGTKDTQPQSSGNAN